MPSCSTVESGAPISESARTGNFLRTLPKRSSALRGQCADAHCPRPLAVFRFRPPGNFVTLGAMSLPVISIAQMREWERATWKTGQTEAEVIHRVGGKIAQRALQLTRPGDAILILAGKGHNGDDARAAREFLTDRRVETLDIAAPENDLPELERVLLQKPALVIDGLFGIGLDRPLTDDWKKIIKTVNRSGI